jgi:histidinol-phosphatase (PHP family)
MKTNYHTHHYLCNHAEGNTSEYVKEAIKLGFTEIGMSDHAPNPLMTDTHVRMDSKDFHLYLSDIDNAIDAYGHQISIKKGVEVEYFDNHETYYDDLIKNLDYMILGQHYISKTRDMNNLQSCFALKTKEEILLYSDYLIKGMNTKRFEIIAHPDLYMCGYKDFDETAIEIAHRIGKAAEETGVILEFNANGYRKRKQHTPQGLQYPYPRLEFWDIIKNYDVKIIFSSDCHDPSYLYDEVVVEAENDFKKLQNNKIEKI